MTLQATGSFDVSMHPADVSEAAAAGGLTRLAIDKRYHGDLEATGAGEMFAAMTAVKGSAGYVAMEFVDGTLAGRAGSFVLQHSGTMDRGTPLLSVTVVPDSGTGDLHGLSGQLDIRIVDGDHFYTFDYTLFDDTSASA